MCVTKHNNMSKYVFVIISFLLGTISSVADDKDKEILINKSIPTTRSLSDMPHASINAQTCLLVVSMDDCGMYTLYVQDSLFETVYQSVLPANGLQYHYDLSGIGEGYFRLVIEGASGEYEGFFSLTR